MECSGKIWNVLEKFGKFWKSLEYFGKIWNNWKNLEYFRKIWNILEKFGIFWKNLEYFGKILIIHLLFVDLDYQSTLFRSTDDVAIIMQKKNGFI